MKIYELLKISNLRKGNVVSVLNQDGTVFLGEVTENPKQEKHKTGWSVGVKNQNGDKITIGEQDIIFNPEPTNKIK